MLHQLAHPGHAVGKALEIPFGQRRVAVLGHQVKGIFFAGWRRAAGQACGAQCGLHFPVQPGNQIPAVGTGAGQHSDLWRFNAGIPKGLLQRRQADQILVAVDLIVFRRLPGQAHQH